jgi:Leucine-rich repeat (LRR) protein
MKSSILCFALILLIAAYTYAGPVGKETQSLFLDLPDEIWTHHILPKIPARDVGDLRLVTKKFNYAVNSRLKSFSPVAEACDKGTAKDFVKQQWSANYQTAPWLTINNQSTAETVHKCLRATKIWVEKLEEPQAIKLKLTLFQPNITADFLLDRDLFAIRGKSRLSLELFVTESRRPVDKVFKAVSDNECIKSLEMSSNHMGDDQFAKLATILKKNTALQRLDLNRNGISPRGARSLANALKTNTGLLDLELGSNAVKDEGALAISEALKKNGKLRTLILASNEIGDEGAIALAEALKNNTSLQELDLSFNKISVETKKEILVLAEKKKTKNGEQFILRI